MHKSQILRFIYPKLDMIDLLRDRRSALMAERLVQQEKRAEYNFSSALNAEATKKIHDMSVHEGMGLHDTVSYKGDCYVMEAAEPEGEWPPSRAVLSAHRMPNGLLGLQFVRLLLTGSRCCCPDHIPPWIL